MNRSFDGFKDMIDAAALKGGRQAGFLSALPSSVKAA